MRQMRDRQCGIGIVELMIALTMSLVLTAGVFQFYSASKQSYRLADALSRVQETGRLAMNAIARDARMADFWGCGARACLNFATNLSSTDIQFQQAVSGTNGTSGASDELILRYGQSIGRNVVSHNGVKIVLSPAVPISILKKDDYIAICNPVNADIFRVTAIEKSAGPNTNFDIAPGPTGAFARTYDATAEVAVATQSTYRIQNGSDSNQPGLFVSINGANAQELIEGVENMQIVYGEDTNGDRQADRYVAAGTAGLNMGRVVSLRISLLVRSSEPNVTNEAQPVAFNGATVSGADRRLRQVYTATLTLRNRVL